LRGLRRRQAAREAVLHQDRPRGVAPEERANAAISSLCRLALDRRDAVDDRVVPYALAAETTRTFSPDSFASVS
jgi:hypothetical protein